MWTVQEEVETAVKTLNFSPELLRKMPESTAEQIIHLAKNKYVIGNPRAWWLGLALPCKEYDYEFPSDGLVEYVPEGEKCYWIPESENEALSVYETTIDIIVKIMEMTAYFEYYVLGKEINWLLIQNDHSQLIVVGE